MIPTGGVCFSLHSPGISNVLITDVSVCAAFDPTKGIPTLHPQFKAIWDTGATRSVITQNVVNALGIKHTTFAKASGVHGSKIVPVFLVGFFLPNKVVFPSLSVTEGQIKGGVDVLIGMDVICAGDFALTNHGGRTTMSFRVPSSECIDFVARATGKPEQNPYPAKAAIGALVEHTGTAPIPTGALPPGAVIPPTKPQVPKVGRNDPCPCNSGKKYKHCHGGPNPPP